MRSFFCPGRRAILVLLPVIALIFCATFVGTASAATPAAGSVSAASPTTRYDSQLLPNFASCQPSNLLCDYYTLSVMTAGQVQVCTSYEQDILGMNDVDVFIYDSSGNQIASGESSANPECVIFTAAVGTYTIALSETMGVLPVNTTTTVTLFPSTGGNANGGGSTTGQVFMSGGGKVSDVAPYTGGQFALPVFADTSRHGKIKFQRGNTCNFRADENPSWIVITNYQGHPSWMHVEGQGYNNNQSVSFVADIQDNGEPGSSGSAGGPDVFTVTARDQQSNIVCGGGGPLTGGNTQYHPTGV